MSMITKNVFTSKPNADTNSVSYEISSAAFGELDRKELFRVVVCGKYILSSVPKIPLAERIFILSITDIMNNATS